MDTYYRLGSANTSTLLIWVSAWVISVPPYLSSGFATAILHVVGYLKISNHTFPLDSPLQYSMWLDIWRYPTIPFLWIRHCNTPCGWISEDIQPYLSSGFPLQYSMWLDIWRYPTTWSIAVANPEERIRHCNTPCGWISEDIQPHGVLQWRIQRKGMAVLNPSFRN